MIPRYRFAQRHQLEPMTLAQFVEKQKRSKARAQKRMAKGRELGLGPDRRTIISQLDYLWSLAIRRRDRIVHSGLCLVCWAKREMGLQISPCNPITLAYHICPRGDRAVRWEMDNGLGACAPCNDGELWSRSKSSLRARYREIHAFLIGWGRLIELEALARTSSHFSNQDLLDIRDKLKIEVEGGI